MRPAVESRSGVSLKEHVNMTVDECGDECADVDPNFPCRNDAPAPTPSSSVAMVTRELRRMAFILHTVGMTLVTSSVACENSL
jgi:hypothetical protein